MTLPLETGDGSTGGTFSPVSRSSPVLLVGHGTRDSAGVAEFLELARRVAELLPERRVEPSFLELAEPTIEQGLHRLLASGATSCIVVPLLLFAAGHANRDVPDAVQAALAGRPDFAWRQAGPLDPHEPLRRLSHKRYLEALARLPNAAAPAESTRNTSSSEGVQLLWIGRGGSDPHALAKLQGFAQRRRETFADDAALLAAERFAFVAIAEPKFKAALTDMAASPARRVVVQPHLLFHGLVFDEIRAEAERAAAGNPAQHWAVAEPLGPDRLLAEAVVAGIRECEEGGMV